MPAKNAARAQKVAPVKETPAQETAPAKKPLTELQQYITDMRKPINFINKLKEMYENLEMVTVCGNDAKYNKDYNSWIVPIFKVCIKISGKKPQPMTTSKLWELFKNKPQLKFGGNTKNRVLKADSFLQIDIGTELKTMSKDGKDMQYYASIGNAVEGPKLRDMFGDWYDKFNEITREKGYAKQYTWFADSEDTSGVESMDLTELMDDDDDE